MTTEVPAAPAAEPVPTPAAAEPAAAPAIEIVAPPPSEPVSRRDRIKASMDGAAPARTDGRDEKGKFVAAASADTSVAAPAAKKEYKYPASWKKDYEPVYQKLAATPDYAPILDEIQRREDDYHKGIEPYKESASFGQAIRQILAPHEQYLQQVGLTPDAAIQRLIQTEQILRVGTPEQKMAMLQNIMQSYGVNMQQQEQGEQQEVDPVTQQLYQQLQQQAQAINQFGQYVQNSTMEKVNGEIETFRKDHEFLEDVRVEMGDLIAKGIANGLEDAYDRAVWSNPAIRAKVLAKQSSDAEAKRKEDARKSVEAAKTAAVQIKGAPSSGASATRPPSGRNRREMIQNLMDRTV